MKPIIPLPIVCFCTSNDVNAVSYLKLFKEAMEGYKKKLADMTDYVKHVLNSDEEISMVFFVENRKIIRSVA